MSLKVQINLFIYGGIKMIRLIHYFKFIH